MDPKNIFVFTDIDLDGATSLLTLHWALNVPYEGIKFKATTVTNFRKEFLSWATEDSLDNYKAVLFLDLDTSSSADLIDHKNSIIIDHHQSHVLNKEKYKNAKLHVTETTSCAKLVYNIFKDKLTNLTTQQKYLIALANDYDCYSFSLKETYDINCLFTNTQKTLDKTRTHKFLERFYKGFDSFNRQELNIIKEYTTGRDAAISALQIFAGDLSISKQKVRVVGTMGVKYVNDVCDYLLKEHSADIAFFINTNNSHVSFRKKKTCTVNMSKLAETLCQGGGHEYAAGGKLTETFMEFTKQLTPLPN